MWLLLPIEDDGKRRTAPASLAAGAYLAEYARSEAKTKERALPGIDDLFSLAGRAALVTGGSQGIGFALAEGLKAAGARIIVNGRDAGKLAAAAERLGGAEILPFDVTDHAAARAAVDGYETDAGPIDILVNNAGMQH